MEIGILEDQKGKVRRLALDKCISIIRPVIRKLVVKQMTVLYTRIIRHCNTSARAVLGKGGCAINFNVNMSRAV